MMNKISDRMKQMIFEYFPTTQRIFAFNRYIRDQWIAKESARMPPDTYVIDVGAGSCPYRHLVSGHCRYFAYDFSALNPSQLQGRRGYGQLDVIGDINLIPLVDACMDVVICTEVLEHVPEPILAVREVVRILKEGGLLLISAPLRSGLHQEPYHFYGGFTPYWYRRFLNEFETISIMPVGGLFKMYGESSLHVAVSLAPWSVKTSSRVRNLGLFMIWLATLPWFAVLCPLLCHLLDYLLPLEWGTVGYHVKATKFGKRIP